MSGSATGDRHVGHARTVSVLAIAEMAGKVASFAMFAVAARVLGPADFGEFSWSLNLALLLSVFVVWGFDTALIQLAAKRRDRLDAVLSDVLAVRLLLIIPAMAVVLVLPSGAGDNVAVSLVLAAAVLADSMNQAIRSAAAVLERQRGVAVNLVIQRMLTAGLAIGVLLAGGGVLAMSWAYLAGTLLGVVAMFWSGHRVGLAPSPRLVTRAGMIEVTHGSTALGISSMLNMLVFRIDSLLLGWMLTTTAVGAYTAAYKLFETVLFVMWSVDRVAMPAMAAAEGHEPIRNGVHRACSVVFAVYIPYAVVVALRGSDILNLVYGEPYGTDSYGSLAILGLALIPYSIQYLVASGLLARNRNTYVTVSGGVALVVNVIANLLLIPRYGPAGAAIATVLAFTAQSGMLWVGMVRMSGSPRMLRASLVADVASAAMIPVLLAPIPLIIDLVLAGAVYGLVWLVAAGWWDKTARTTLLGMVGVKPR